MNRFVAGAILVITSEVGAQPGVTPDTRDLDEPSAPAISAVTRPPDGAFIGGGSVLDHDELFNAAFAIEGGLKLGAAPLWLRGLFAAGSSFDFEGGGSLVRGMLGIELRRPRDRGLQRMGRRRRRDDDRRVSAVARRAAAYLARSQVDKSDSVPRQPV
jgi:hypothetical protein